MLAAATVALAPTSPADAATSTVRVTDAGDLIVTATNSRDEITISQEGVDRFRIQIETDHGEVIDHDVDGVTGHATFNMRGGNDIIYLTGRVTFPDNLTIKWGGGDSHLGSRSNPVIGINGNFTVVDGNGETSLELDRFSVLGRTRLSLGGGAAYVTIDGLFFDDFTAVTSTSGQLKRFDVFSAVFYDKFDLKSGNKSDNVSIAQSWFPGVTRVNLRGGDDTFELTQSLLDGRTNVTMGTGNDTSTLNRTAVANVLSFRADGGDDRLNVFASTFKAQSTLNGGGGTDRLFGQVNNFVVEPQILGFE